MTKRRLQVLLEDDELREIQRIAKGARLTTAEWVRQRLREAREQQAKPDIATKLAAIHRAYRHQPPAPAPDIDRMLEEIEHGYLEQSPPT